MIKQSKLNSSLFSLIFFFGLFNHTSISYSINNLERHLDLANRYFHQNKLNLAKYEYEKVLDIAPNNGRAYFSIGEIYQKQGALNKAITKYEKSIALNPDLVQAYLNLGVIYSN